MFHAQCFMSSGPCVLCPVFYVVVRFHVLCSMSSVLCSVFQCSMPSVPLLQFPAFHVSSAPCLVFQCSISSVHLGRCSICPVFHVQRSMTSVPCRTFHDQCSNVRTFQCSAFHVFSVPCPMFHAYPTVTYEKLYLGKGGSLFYSEGILFFRNDVFQHICFSTPKQD